MSYRERIKAQQYLQEQRDEFPNDPWRYTYTAKEMGLEWSDFNRDELKWVVSDLERLLYQMETWPGLVPYTKEQFAIVNEKMAAVKKCL